MFYRARLALVGERVKNTVERVNEANFPDVSGVSGTSGVPPASSNGTDECAVNAK